MFPKSIGLIEASTCYQKVCTIDEKEGQKSFISIGMLRKIVNDSELISSKHVLDIFILNRANDDF
ncbi:MAG: hypothetical protein ACFFAU_05060 [Candidatus Hodarchaeota archaeon]